MYIHNIYTYMYIYIYIYIYAYMYISNHVSLRSPLLHQAQPFHYSDEVGCLPFRLSPFLTPRSITK